MCLSTLRARQGSPSIPEGIRKPLRQLPPRLLSPIILARGLSGSVQPQCIGHARPTAPWLFRESWRRAWPIHCFRLDRPGYPPEMGGYPNGSPPLMDPSGSSWPPLLPGGSAVNPCFDGFFGLPPSGPSWVIPSWSLRLVFPRLYRYRPTAPRTASPRPVESAGSRTTVLLRGYRLCTLSLPAMCPLCAS